MYKYQAIIGLQNCHAAEFTAYFSELHFRVRKFLSEKLVTQIRVNPNKKLNVSSNSEHQYNITLVLVPIV